jgi:hypothetical protein
MSCRVITDENAECSEDSIEASPCGLCGEMLREIGDGRIKVGDYCS